MFFYFKKQTEHKKHNFKERIRVFSEHQNGNKNQTDSYFSNLKQVQGWVISYPNLGLIISSTACNWLGKETNWGGRLRTDICAAPVARFPFKSDIV